jgi:hypothetical protein
MMVWIVVITLRRDDATVSVLRYSLASSPNTSSIG